MMEVSRSQEIIYASQRNSTKLPKDTIVISKH